MKALLWITPIFASVTLAALHADAQTTRTNTNQSAEPDVVARIRDEGLKHSEVMQTLSYLTDVIGPRLTGSANLKRANEWTRDKLSGWGLTNSHLEAWGPFGRGWALKRFSAQVVEPQAFPLIACPNAWTPGFDKPLVANVVLFDARTNADLEKFKGKLAGAIVLNGQKRELKPSFEPLAVRQTDSNLLWYANAGPPGASTSFSNRLAAIISRRGDTNAGSGFTRTGTNTSSGPAGPIRGVPSARSRGQPRYLSFLAKEGAALIVYASQIGDGGTVFVSGASVPGSDPAAAFPGTNTPRAWATNAPHIPPQITLGAEDFNRLARMIEQGQTLKMAVDLQTEYQDEDYMVYNTIAELPGSDLKNEVVMLGAHLDSWHAGTGATDNAAGVAATIEAMRILSALNLHPRRTIRIGLWAGEEQGLLGSKAYVTSHLGYYTNLNERSTVRAPKDQPAETSRRGATNAPAARRLVRGAEYDSFSAYFNLDNGGGKIRGVYLQGNEAVRPLFRRWLEPLRDGDAQTLTLANTSGTDHQSFDGIGLPGFQFIQDPLDYWTRTHHSNEDVYDRVPPEDLKQAAIILATFAYNAANLDEKLPRKPLDQN